MLVSIVIAVYNVEKYLRWCLESVINQSYKNIQIICVNDGSTDSSLKILQSYARQDSRIEIIDLENGGVSRARNAGIAAAKGSFITFVDGDDELKKNAIERAVTHIDDDIDVVWFEPEIIYQANAEMKNGDAWYYTVKGNGKQRVSDKLLLTGDINVWDKLFRLSVIKKYNIQFPEGLIFEDATFTYNFLPVARNVYLLPEKLYIYYRHPSSIMASTFSKRENYSICHIFILDHIYNFWMKHDLIRFRKWIFQRICINYFENAMRTVPDFEKARVVWEMTRRLRKWNIGCEEDDRLRRIQDGSYEISL